MKKHLALFVIFGSTFLLANAQMPQSMLPRFVRWIDNNQLIVNTKLNKETVAKDYLYNLTTKQYSAAPAALPEAKKVIAVMKACGLKRKVNGLEIYVMIEIPSNALLAEEFAKHFDGFSIGSNDLTQLTLGADRDSSLLSDIFSPFDPAVMQLIEMTLSKAKKSKTHTGLCGQAPSDYPEYASFLVKNGINSISFNPDALIKGIENIAKAEKIKYKK